MVIKREFLFEHLLEPGTGKAVPVRRGQILRITQMGDGQCADFNAFNLDDYKEHLHCGHTRISHGLFPAVGATLWSAPPRERVMYTLIADTVGTNDVNYARCTGVLYESRWGFQSHTNCQDMQAEAQREYGLTPDDVHDSFNFWMHTAVDAKGRMRIEPQLARKGDYVELIAHFHTLAVVNVCGADLNWTSNFELKPLKIQIRAATQKEIAKWLMPSERPYRNQQVPTDFRIGEIKATRLLIRDPNYIAKWPVFPMRTEPIVIKLSRKEIELVGRLGKKRTEFGQTAGEILRSIFFVWWAENRVNTTKP